MRRARFSNLGKYLCICGTSVPSERVFSTAGHIASRSRSRLLPQNVSKLLFLAKTCSRNESTEVQTLGVIRIQLIVSIF